MRPLQAAKQAVELLLVSLKHPEHRQIVERFDRAIAAMKADGSYVRLLRQHGF